MKILCGGDLHLGRRSSRLGTETESGAHSAAAAWHAMVELAIEERVGLVALSGDLVDRANRYFEAFGPLERGVRRLTAAGIPVTAVAGNHDHDVLPRLAASFGKGFRLLGAGGRWEGFTVQAEGAPALHVVGWSFPAERVARSPLERLPPLPRDGVPVLGLLHADLEQPASPYAPVRAAELRGTSAAFWLLGHLHAPRLHEEAGAAPILYPGSPQALDPGEPGAHGAWIVEIAPGRLPAARFVPLSSVRYETVEVDAGGVAEPEELDRRVAEGVRSALEEVMAEGCGPLRHLACRVRVTGRTPLHRLVEARLRAGAGELEAEHGEVRARIERVEVETRPAVELAEVARAGDAPGVLARFVLALDAGVLEPAHERLLAELAARAGEVRRTRPYQALGDPPPTAPEVRALARRQALLLLDGLLAGREAA
jgi:DNA repair protein SbcD/Mre11